MLMVGGDIDMQNNLTTEIAPEASLDLFVGGSIRAIGEISFGDLTRPSASRVYVAGEGELDLVGGAAFIGNVYAPRATLRLVGEVLAHGALFVGGVDGVGEIEIAYDRAILDVSPCDDPALHEPAQPEDPQDPEDPERHIDVPCSRCGYCLSGLACVDQLCGLCREDADCCGQSVCNEEGRCVPLAD